MKPLMIVGIVLIVIGVIALAYGGFSFTTSETVAEVGPLKIEKDKTRSVRCLLSSAAWRWSGKWCWLSSAPARAERVLPPQRCPQVGPALGVRTVARVL